MVEKRRDPPSLESLAEREQIWIAFMNDPERETKRTESKANGPLITHASNQILQPTAFSAVQ